MSDKTKAGNFFEDFRTGQTIAHATPRTISDGDSALYQALYGGRFALHSSSEFARRAGYPQAPIDDMLVFHIVFGKTVPDISLNAVANLGYANGRFLAPVFPGDTLKTTSEIIGLKENSNGKTGVVYVRSRGENQNGTQVLDYVRWVMVRKRDPGSPAPEAVVPDLPDGVPADALKIPDNLELSAYDTVEAGSDQLWDDYDVGERIDHVDGMTIEEAEHMMATRLYQNTAKVHFNQHTEGESRFGRRLIYGGHIISLARGLSFNGLANAQWIAAINGGRHVAPTFAGDTIYAWSEIADKVAVGGRNDIGALRIRTRAVKNLSAAEFPNRSEDSKDHAAVVLEFDYWALMPRRP
ncbi:MAG: MaoC family dehydratase [Rhodospirillales bacterium]